MMRPNYQIVLKELNLLARLKDFQPMVIGTPPLGIDTETSDLDIACYASNHSQFISYISNELGEFFGFQARCSNIHSEPAICATFQAYSWSIELFCQSVPINQQWGVRHFLIEHRLLQLEPRLRSVIKHLKQSGLKTEPAFAFVLKLSGNPYESILGLEMKSDDELAQLISGTLIPSAHEIRKF